MMHRTTTIIVAIIVVLLLVLTTPKAASRGLSQIPTGRFHGFAEVFVSWTAQRTLVVDISVFNDGAVTGCIGDATLVNGRMSAGRGVIARKLGWKRDWIVTGDLAGAIMERDSIVRSGVTMPLDWTGGRFVGGLTTSGAEFGGRERMKLAAGRMTLLPVAADTSIRHSEGSPCQQ